MIDSIALFSFYLTPKRVGGAELTLGGIDHSKFRGSMTFAPLSDNSGFWNVNVSSITMNDKAVPRRCRSREPKLHF